MTGAVLRAPAQPFDLVLRWTRGTSAAAATLDGLAQSVTTDRRGLLQRLRASYADPVLREAVFLASPTVHDELERWLVDDSALPPRLERTLVSYFLRAAGRCTPFGLFAGCSAVRLDDRTRFTLGPISAARRRSRLDFGYQDSVVTGLTGLAEVQQSMLVQPNSTLYLVADKLRYAVSAMSADHVRSHHLAATVATDPVELVVELAEAGASVEDLAQRLASELADRGTDVSVADAESFVKDMVQEQLLVPLAAPRVTGSLGTAGLLSGLPDVPPVRLTQGSLKAADTLLSEMDLMPPGQGPDKYRALCAVLEPLPAQVDVARLVQVDMRIPADAVTVGRVVIAEVTRAVGVLAALPAQTNGQLDRFRADFDRRYDARSVPLLEALDQDAGVGYGNAAAPAADASPLVSGLPFVREEEPVLFNRHHRTMLQLLANMLRTGQTELNLELTDLDELRDTTSLPLPDAFHVFATVCAASADAVDTGSFSLLVKDAGGPAGASLLGRFCHLDPGLRALVTEQLRAEEAWHPDRVYAELVHLPEGRTGNVIARPVLRTHEIPLLGGSGVERTRQISLGDLRVSVENGRIVLRSSRLDREVVPRLTTAHNFTDHSLGIYRFLCDLQFQGVKAALGWDWGPLAAAPFLPRVRFGRLVLARARWLLSAGDVAALRAPRADADRYAGIQDWRRRRGVPRWVVLVDGDNELVLDLDNVLCIEAFLGGLRPGAAATVAELFPGPDDMCLRGPAGERYVHELVLTCRRVPDDQDDAPVVSGLARPDSPPASQPGGSRRFAPGSSWLYLKLYGGEASADEVLTGPVSQLTAEARAAGLVDNWFFLRYADPDPHLRVRWHGECDRLVPELLPYVCAAMEPALDAGYLWRTEVATYDREVERYGGSVGVEIAEQIFEADSDAVVEVLALAEGPRLAELRWRLALLGSDRLLHDLRLSGDARWRWARATSASFMTEFGGGKDLPRVLGERFRSRRSQLTGLFDGSDELGAVVGPVLERRSARLAPLVEALYRSQARGDLLQPIGEIAASIVHMHVNRVLRSDQRVTEMVIADWLQRIYRADAVRTPR